MHKNKKNDHSININEKKSIEEKNGPNRSEKQIDTTLENSNDKPTSQKFKDKKTQIQPETKIKSDKVKKSNDTTQNNEDKVKPTKAKVKLNKKRIILASLIGIAIVIVIFIIALTLSLVLNSKPNIYI